MNKVALVIIYNHRFDKNIEILEKIYDRRFSYIYHLVPFYDGVKSNVIPVYENSYYFQGYVAQGLKHFFRQDYSHYFFVADDMALNPVLNEDNYAQYLKLNQDSCFIPVFNNLHGRTWWWARVKEAYQYRIESRGVEAKNELPNYEIKPLYFHDIWKNPFTKKNLKQGKNRLKLLSYLYNKFRKKEQYHLSYPLIGAYSDIFVVSSDTIKQFCHYCGVFAATNLHVEVAIPTALVLSAKVIVTEKELKLQGKALWTEDDFEILHKYENQLDKLFDNFPTNHLYLHPIKLSRWKIKL
jgi:hypothetical protein